MLQGGQRHASAHHIGTKGVPQPMGMGLADLGKLAMVTEQRAESCRGHGLTALVAFQGDEQSGRVGPGPFPARIVPEHFEDFRRQGYDALLASFAEHPHLAFGELQVLRLKRQDLAGAQTIEEHQAYQGETAKGAEALPEFSHFFGRQGHDDPSDLFEAEAQGEGAARPPVAERGSRPVAALEVDRAGGKISAGVEALAATDHAQTMIDRWWGGFRMPLELMADIVDERGFGHLGEGSAPRFKPAGEVEQVIGVSAEGGEGELAEALGVEEGIRPIQLALVLILQAIRGSAGGHGRLMDHGELHLGWAAWRQRVKSEAWAPRTK